MVGCVVAAVACGQSYHACQMLRSDGVRSDGTASCATVTFCYCGILPLWYAFVAGDATVNMRCDANDAYARGCELRKSGLCLDSKCLGDQARHCFSKAQSPKRVDPVRQYEWSETAISGSKTENSRSRQCDVRCEISSGRSDHPMICLRYTQGNMISNLNSAP